MADAEESAIFTDPAAALSQGKRHLLVRDYSMAVTALAQACELLAEKHGDTADELGGPYLLYGRALLGLAREEAGVLGGGVPGTEETEEIEEEDEDDDEEEGDEDEKEAESKAEANEEATSSTEKREAETAKESATSDKQTDESKSNEDEPIASEATSTEKPEPSDAEKPAKSAESNKTDDSKLAERKKEPESAECDDEKATTSITNGQALATEQNGSAATSNGTTEKEEDEGDDVNKEDDEDEVNNLQLAWEVLELAKLVLVKRGPPGWKQLAEAYRLLGEVAMEGGNHQGALTDLQGCLNLMGKIDPCEPRAIAEIHYQLGLAHSLANDFDASIEQFAEATSLLEARIKQLEETTEPPSSDDPFYSVEGEIKELKELLPEIQEKIADMKDFKQEACRVVIEGIKSKVAEGCSNGAGTSSEGATRAAGSSSSTSPNVAKPASDISHLVRKKRKADEAEVESSPTSACKKPMPEKTP